MGKRPSPDAPEFRDTEKDVRAMNEKLLNLNGTRSLDSFHRELGLLLWDKCGMSRHEKGLREALQKIPKLREEFWHGVRVLGSEQDYNQALERAGRVADFLEFAELMCMDALERDERSEERRVGKECRSRWTPDDEKKKEQRNKTLEQGGQSKAKHR